MKSGAKNDAQQIALAAKHIEARLFVTASNMEEYQDPSTLRTRFQKMVTSMLQRRIQKAKEAAIRSSSSSYRLKVISATVGTDTARQIFLLVRQIELLQMGKPAEDGSSAPAPTGTRTMRVNTPSFNLGGQQRVPKPVRELFFESSIADTFYFTPLDRLKDVPWAKLIIAAKKSIREYHSWIAESQSKAS